MIQTQSTYFWVTNGECHGNTTHTAFKSIDYGLAPETRSKLRRVFLHRHASRHQCNLILCYLCSHDPNLEEFLTSLYNKTSMPPNTASPKQSPAETTEAKKRRNKKPKA